MGTISFPDGSSKRINPGGEEEVTFPNGTKVAVKPGGDKVLQLPNGEKEEHTRMWKRRSYPDGTVKILHADGRQETRYAGGESGSKIAKETLYRIQPIATDWSKSEWSRNCLLIHMQPVHVYCLILKIITCICPRVFIRFHTFSYIT